MSSNNTPTIRGHVPNTRCEPGSQKRDHTRARVPNGCTSQDDDLRVHSAAQSAMALLVKKRKAAPLRCGRVTGTPSRSIPRLPASAADFGRWNSASLGPLCQARDRNFWPGSAAAGCPRLKRARTSWGSGRAPGGRRLQGPEHRWRSCWQGQWGCEAAEPGLVLQSWARARARPHARHWAAERIAAPAQLLLLPGGRKRAPRGRGHCRWTCPDLVSCAGRRLTASRVQLQSPRRVGALAAPAPQAAAAWPGTTTSQASQAARMAVAWPGAKEPG
mmetsp:Transcript_66958/g.215858  ORF Transcript_66958/g.215858 Transcript_66958/m.215858 type:complete len:274 (+) Transcript_66958:86-907(+)